MTLGADLPIGLLRVSPTGDLLEANARAARILRLDTATSPDLASCRLGEPAQCAAFLDALRHAPDQHLEAYPLVLWRADGSVVRCRATSARATSPRTASTQAATPRGDDDPATEVGGTLGDTVLVLHDVCCMESAWEAVQTILAPMDERSEHDADAEEGRASPPSAWLPWALARLGQRLDLCWTAVLRLEEDGRAHAVALWHPEGHGGHRAWTLANTPWMQLAEQPNRLHIWPCPLPPDAQPLLDLGPADGMQAGLMLQADDRRTNLILAVGRAGTAEKLALLREPLELAGRLLAFRLQQEAQDRARDHHDTGYEACFTHGRDVIVLLDPAGRVRTVSPALERMLGYRPEELRDAPLGDLPLLSPASVPIVQRALRHARRGSPPTAPTRIVMRARDGRRILTEVTLTPHRVNGRVVGYVLLGRDITESTRLLARLEAIGEERRATFEHSFYGVVICERDLAPVRLANPRALDLLGYDAKALRNLTWQTLVHPDDQALYKALRDPLEVSERSETPHPIRLAHRNGSWLKVRIGAVALRNATGQRSGIVFTIQDTAERNTHRRQAERLGSIMSELDIEILVIDGHGCLEYMNRRALAATGSAAVGLIGRSLWDVDLPGHLGAAVRVARASVAAVSSSSKRLRHLSAAGEEATFAVNVTLISPGPGEDAPGALISCRDVSAETGLEEQVQEAQKLEALGTLASGIAHDFNNVLAPIVGYADMGLMEIDVDDRLRRYFERIAKAARRASKLVRQILTFGRSSQRGRRSLDLGVLARETLDLLRHTIPAQVVFATSIAEDLPTVEANATQIEQVLMNLCVNAAQAMEAHGGRLVVSLSAADMETTAPGLPGALPPGRYVRILVGDNGPGMPPEVRERIFQPFFTTKRAQGGSGLGLSVVHRIIVSHGGRIHVESEPDCGTTFEVLLPCRTAARVAEAVAAPAPRGGKERILVLDDEPVVGHVTRDMLRGLGYKVVALSKPARAVELLRRDPLRFDLILTDLSMPGLSGIEVAEAVHELRPDLPLLLMTGNLSASSRTECRLAGFHAILEKPFDAGDIDHAIRQCLDVLGPRALPEPATRTASPRTDTGDLEASHDQAAPV